VVPRSRRGDRYNEATTLARIADSHAAVGDQEVARETWQRALTILEQIDHPEADKVRAKLTQ
jgi:hypothetical protein